VNRVQAENLRELEGFNIIKYVWDNRAKLNMTQASVDLLLGLQHTQTLRGGYPNLSKEFLTWELLRVLEAVSLFTGGSMGPKDFYLQPVVTKDSILYIDPVSNVRSKDISYGYITDFTIFMLHDTKRLDMNTTHKSVVSMIGIKPLCGTLSYAELPKHYSFLLGVTGTLKCLDHGEVSLKFSVLSFQLSSLFIFLT
jgi:hypothetical protein